MLSPADIVNRQLAPMTHAADDSSRLMKVLVGQRFRIGARHWVVERGRVEHNRLQLDVSGTSRASIACELPDSFDCRSGEHMAWLLGRIEEELKANHI
jgi:hypothetical protein